MADAFGYKKIFQRLLNNSKFYTVILSIFTLFSVNSAKNQDFPIA
jgi:hypothetical protein